MKAGGARRFLQIYLRDHLAAALAGTELAKRAAGNNRRTELGAILEELAREIDEDRRTLVELMGQLRIEPDQLKMMVAWSVEKVARLKPNGQLLRYSPLSRLLELEVLLAGIEGKHALWTALRATARRGHVLDTAQLKHLEERALDQRSRVEALRLEAARDAFSEDPTG
jgi:hypothetical protein